MKKSRRKKHNILDGLDSHPLLISIHCVQDAADSHAMLVITCHLKGVALVETVFFDGPRQEKKTAISAAINASQIVRTYLEMCIQNH